MSYDLAVWEGTRPATADEAFAEYRRLYDEFMERSYPTSLAPRIQRYVETLLSRWPDITTDEGLESPWADGPLMANASGPIVYFAMVTGTASDVVDEIARLAAANGLVCFDPQSRKLR